MEPSKFVKQVRMKLALNQKEFGRKLGDYGFLISRQRGAIVRYERGEDVPPAIMFAIEEMVAEHEGRKPPMTAATEAKLKVLRARQKENVKKRKKRK